MRPAVQGLIDALRQVGGRVLKDDETQIVSWCDGIADDAIAAVVKAIVANAPSGGIKSFEWKPVKDDLLSSIPMLQQDANAEIKTLVDNLDAFLLQP